MKRSLGWSSTFWTAAAVQRAASEAEFPLPVLGSSSAELSVIIETSGHSSFSVPQFVSPYRPYMCLIIQMQNLSLPFLAQRVVLLITGLCFQETGLTSQNFSTKRSQLSLKCKQ